MRLMSFCSNENKLAGMKFSRVQSGELTAKKQIYKEEY